MILQVTIVFLSFLAINIAMAWWHSVLIGENRRIQHGWWTAGYLAAAAIPCLLFSPIYLPMVIMVRSVFFSPVLSIFRGLPVTYISQRTTSVMDKLEYRIFHGNWYARQIVYVVILDATILAIFLIR